MVNNYPEYAAGVNYKKTDTNGNRHFYSAQVVADPANETVESKLIKDGVVIDEGGATVEALNVTENGTYSEEGKAYSPVVVNVAGGSSDFSTAEVTVTALDPGLNFAMPVVKTFDNISMIVPTVGVGSTPETLIIPLYKGKALLIDELTEYWSVAVTGDIEYDEDFEAYIITGDGTITVTDK